MQVQAFVVDDVSSRDENIVTRNPARIRSVERMQADRVAVARMPAPRTSEGLQSMPRTVCIVDPNEATIGPLATLLRSVEFNVEAFSTPRRLLDWQQAGAITGQSCIVSEIRLPEMSGLDLQHKLRVVWPAASVILASEQADVATAVRAMRAGAVSVLKKPICEQELIDLLNSCFRNSRVDELSSFLERSRRLLTPRQRDIFDHLIVGLQTKEVAIELGLSPRTVDIYRTQIAERLEVSSISVLIKRVLSLSVHNAAAKTRSTDR